MPGDADRPTLTVDEAITWLDPPISRRLLATLIQELKITPAGKRPSTGGRPANAYDAGELMRLHSGLASWLARATRPGGTPAEDDDEDEPRRRPLP